MIGTLALVNRRAVARREEDRAAELADTARLIRNLSRAVSPDSVVEAIADELGAATEADHVVIVRRRPRAWALDATLVSVGAGGVPSTTTLPSTDLAAPGPGGEPSVRRLESRVADAFGLANTIASPLVVESGIVGAIVLSRRTGHAWGDAARRRLAMSASEASAALERAYTLSEAEARASTDPLTGLPNRRRFDDHVRSLDGRRRANDRVGVLMIDLDHFKRLNDAHGHPAGDRVLAAAARAIATSVRDVDLPARVGGEEFAVVLRDPSGAMEVAERVRAAIAAVDLGADGQLARDRVDRRRRGRRRPRAAPRRHRAGGPGAPPRQAGRPRPRRRGLTRADRRARRPHRRRARPSRTAARVRCAPMEPRRGTRRELAVLATTLVVLSRPLEGDLVWLVGVLVLATVILGGLQALDAGEPRGVALESVVTPAVASAAAVVAIRLVPVGLLLLPAVVLVYLLIERALVAEAQLLARPTVLSAEDRNTLTAVALVSAFLAFAGIAGVIPGALVEPADGSRRRAERGSDSWSSWAPTRSSRRCWGSALRSWSRRASATRSGPRSRTRPSSRSARRRSGRSPCRGSWARRSSRCSSTCGARTCGIRVGSARIDAVSRRRACSLALGLAVVAWNLLLRR